MWRLITEHKNIIVEWFVYITWSESAVTSEKQRWKKDLWYTFFLLRYGLTSKWGVSKVVSSAPVSRTQLDWACLVKGRGNELETLLCTWSRFNSCYPACCICRVSLSFFPLLFLSSLSCGSHGGILLPWESSFYKENSWFPLDPFLSFLVSFFVCSKDLQIAVSSILKHGQRSSSDTPELFHYSLVKGKNSARSQQWNKFHFLVLGIL